MTSAFDRFKLGSPFNRDAQRSKEEEESSGGEEGSSGGEGSGYLVPQTERMEDLRRLDEQEGLRRLTKARINARDREQTYFSTPEGELQNDIVQHPFLDGQQHDGVDIQLSHVPYLNRDAKTKYENAQREQQLEHQLRLGLMPKLSTAPKPER